MNSNAGFLRLMSWLSPVFPTGGFAYSSGLEAAVQLGLVRDGDTLEAWLNTALRNGSLRNDAVLFSASWQAWDDPKAIEHIAAIGLAMAGSAERYLEITAQAEAFKDALQNWPDSAHLVFPVQAPICVVVGIASGANRIDLSQALSAYLHNAISNQVQAGIRLSVTGQNGAAHILAALENPIAALVENTKTCSLDELGSATIGAEIMAMKHEHLSGRMFRS